MSPTTTKTLSPAELAKLEHAFATNPGSDAYKPLAEAYLGLGRFMEAMVVCKKGVKAHPGSSDPRLLLARVYAEQGKDKKALEELAAALQVAPKDKQILRMAGALQMKTGEVEAGKASLVKAFHEDPNDAETKALLAEWKIDPTAAVPPPPKNGASAAVNDVPSTGPRSGPPVLTPSGGTSKSAPAATPRVTPAHSPPRAPPRASPPRARTADVGADSDEDDYLRASVSNRTKRAKWRSFILLFTALLVSAVSYGVYGHWKAVRNHQIKKSLERAADCLRHDSYDWYKKACDAADQALERDPASGTAHAYLSYAYAIRWGEHGGGDSDRKHAEEHLDAAKKAGELTAEGIGASGLAYRHAAEALIRVYSGKGTQALNDLELQVKTFEDQNRRSALLYMTLGLIQMNSGDYERARENFEKAQAVSPSDPRIYAALGNLYRRVGQDDTALNNFNFALRYEKDHPESMLQMSLLILEQEEPKVQFAAKVIKRLLEADPPPSPRQLAGAQLARALLISRVLSLLPALKPEAQKEVAEATGVPLDRVKAQSEMIKSEERGFDLDRRDPELHLVKGRRLMLEDQTDAAIAETRIAIKLDPSRAQSHIELARALMRKPGGEKEAAEALSIALRNVGESPRLMYMLGNAYRRQGRLDDAIAQYLKALRDPKARNPDARLALGSTYMQKRDFPKAKEALEKAVQEFIGQPPKLAAAYTELARFYEQQNDRSKADQAYQKALNADADFTPAYFFYARFLSGDPSQGNKARTLGQEYLKRDPSGEYANEAKRLL